MSTDTLTPSVESRRELAATPGRVACTHCRLPVPAGLIDHSREEQFCCHGCEGAWQIIHGYGLDGFYDICDQLDTRPQPAGPRDEQFAEFDHEAFQRQYVRRLGDNLHEVTLLIEGLHCAACVWLLEKLPQLVPGLLETRINLARRSATVRWNPQAVALSEIARRFADLGYVPHPGTREAQAELRIRENRRQLLRLAVAGVCAGNAMLVAVALYAGWFSGIAAEHATFFRWVSAGLGLVSLAWPGATFYRGAWQALRSRSPHMDVSLAIGLTAGGVMGLINTVRGAGEIYFDSLCMLIFVLLVGRYFQFRQQQRAADSVALLRSLTPRTARRIDARSMLQTVPVEALQTGDVVEIRAGDLVPADGLVESGRSTLDQSLLTGESAGIPVATGDSVTAGATNLTSLLHVRVTAVGRDSRIGRISELVESASLSHAPIVELANRVSGVFLFVVLGLAVVTLTLWRSAGIDVALEHTIALLIVACPCALGLATPLTIAVALGRAARSSILIRGGEVFERLTSPGILWLDKTGTLTTGRMTLRNWLGDQSLQPHVRALEQGVVHPLAECLVRDLHHSAETQEVSVVDSIYEPGRGVRGIVGGRQLLVGSRRFLTEHNIDLATEARWKSLLPTVGISPLYVAEGGRLVALAVIGDGFRPDTAAAVGQLRRMGWQVGILSGDQPEIVQTVAKQLGIPPERAIGGALPEDKLAIVQRDAQSHTVVMVGDGVNDAAALAAADVGVAVHGGAEASLQAAPVYLGQPGLRSLIELLEGSRKTVAAIRYGLLLSLAYNLTAIGLAVAGCITPLLAAVLMPLSSLSVTTLALLQRTFPRQP